VQGRSAESRCPCGRMAVIYRLGIAREAQGEREANQNYPNNRGIGQFYMQYLCQWYIPIYVYTYMQALCQSLRLSIYWYWFMHVLYIHIVVLVSLLYTYMYINILVYQMLILLSIAPPARIRMRCIVNTVK